MSSKTKSFLAPLLRQPPRDFVLVTERTGRVVAERLLTAFDSESRRRGLLGQSGLSDDTAMVIAPSNAIHTFFMRFAIDVAFVARDGRVVKIRAALAPWRIAAALRGFAVIELAAGALSQAGVQRGDRFVVRRVQGSGFKVQGSEGGEP